MGIVIDSTLDDKFQVIYVLDIIILMILLLMAILICSGIARVMLNQRRTDMLIDDESTAVKISIYNIRSSLRNIHDLLLPRHGSSMNRTLPPPYSFIFGHHDSREVMEPEEETMV